MIRTGVVVRWGAIAPIAFCLGLGIVGCGSSEQRAARHLNRGREALSKRQFNRALIEFKVASTQQPKSAEAQYQLGLARIGLGDIAGAVSAIRRAHELDPKHQGALVRMAEIMAMSGEHAELTASIGKAQQAVAAQPLDAAALNVLAYAEARLNRTADAEQHLRDAIRAAPRNLQADLTLAQLKLERRDPGAAEQVLRSAAMRVPDAPLPHILLARIASSTGRHAEAQEHLRNALKLTSDDAAIEAELGLIEVRLGRTADAERTFRRLADGSDEKFRLMYGLLLYQLGKHDAAIAEFDRLARAGDTTAQARLIEVALTTGKVERAKRLLADALKKNPKDWEARLAQTRLMLREGLHTEAEGLLADLGHQRPESGDVHHLLAWVYRLRGANERYRQELNEALQRSPRLIAARIELAQSLVAANAGKSALEVLDSTTMGERSMLEYLTTRTRALISVGRAAEARQIIGAIPAGSRTLEVLTLDTLLHLQQGNLAGAQASAEEAVRRVPDQLTALELLAISHAAQGGREGAVRRLTKEVETRPNSAATRFTLGRWLAASGRDEQARRAFEAAIAASPGYAPATIELARVLGRSGELPSARQVLEAALATQPEAAAVRALLANVLTRQGDIPGAIQQYRASLRRDMSNWMALNNAAHLLAERHESLDEALQYASRAYTLQPGDPTIADTLGWVRYLRGDYDESIRILESAIQGDVNTRMQYHLAMAYLKVGRRQSGVDMLRTVANRAPRAPEGEDARQLLAQLR